MVHYHCWLSFTIINFQSDWHLISPHNITSESHLKITGQNKGNDHKLKKLLIVKKILLSKLQDISIEKSMENMHTDVGV